MIRKHHICVAPAIAILLALLAMKAMADPFTGVLQYHNDLASTGQNLSEPSLTYSTVNSEKFSRQFSTPVDGQVYAQPLYVRAVDITVGNQTGRHDVIFVATEHASLYAIDASGGNVLWQRSFNSAQDAAVNLIHAAKIIPVPSTDTHSTDLLPEIGITATPVIDPATGNLFIIAKTKQWTGDNDPADPHYVQTLFKVDIHSGNIVASRVIADTIAKAGAFIPRFDEDPYTLGTGSGSMSNPQTNNQSRVYFNALRIFGRCGLVLNDGRITAMFASHGDNGPYHGWVLQFDANSLAVAAAFNDTPNGSGGGIWQSGGSPAVDNHGDLFFETGNGTFDGDRNDSGAATGLDSVGFPVAGNYGDCFIRLTRDPDHTTKENQGKNGWGIRVADYFSPFNNHDLDRKDTDVGSGGVLLLPDEAGSPEHPRLLVGAGKEGKIYLIDRDHMGGFDPVTDYVVQEQGQTPHGGINASFDTPGYFNGMIYYFPGYGGDGRAFGIAKAAFTQDAISHTKDRFGALNGTPSISATGNANGIVWVIDRGSNQLRAYQADDLGRQLWTSADAAQDRDRVGTVIKFSVPTVVDGRVIVGTADHVVVYGPPVPHTSVPAAPANLVAQVPAFNSVRLNWEDRSSNEDAFRIERSTDEKAWERIAEVSANEVQWADTTTLEKTAYYYRVLAINSFNGGSASGPTGVVRVTTPAAPPTGTGDGAAAEYFNDAPGNHFNSAPALQRIDRTVNFNWGSGSPKQDVIHNDHFSVRWTGKLQPQYTTNYTLYVVSDDGAKLWIDNELVIDDWQDHSSHEASGEIKLSAGQKYDLKLEYHEEGSDAEARLLWSAPGTPRQVVPRSQLYSGVTAAGPTDLVVTPASGTQANLSWELHSHNELGIVVERRDGEKAGFLKVATLLPAARTYLDTGLDPAKHYSYRVRAGNFAKDSPNSNEVAVMLPAPPQTPAAARAVKVETNEISLAWEDRSSNEEGFHILRSTAGGTFVVIASLPADATAFVDSGANHKGLTAGTEYDYHVQAYNIAGASDFTGLATATLTDPPTQVTVVEAPNASAAVKWMAPATQGSDKLSYSIFRSGNAEMKDAKKFAVPDGAVERTDEHLEKGATYFYAISANNRGGVSARSDPVQLKLSN